MSQEETLNFEKMAQQWQSAMIDSWSAMTKQYVGSDGFAAASSAYMDWALSGQKAIRNNSAQFMDALEFPKRSDIARLSKQIAQAESRIAETEEAMDTILSTLRRLESKIDALETAPVSVSASPEGSETEEPEKRTPVGAGGRSKKKG